MHVCIIITMYFQFFICNSSCLSNMDLTVLKCQENWNFKSRLFYESSIHTQSQVHALTDRSKAGATVLAHFPNVSNNCLAVSENRLLKTASGTLNEQNQIITWTFGRSVTQ